MVITEERKQLGHIRRELAAFLSPQLAKRTHPIQATVTELSCDSSGSTYRVRINFSVPSKWLIQHESVHQVGDQPIEYTLEESGGNVYVSLNSSEELFAKVRERMSAENIVHTKYGLSHREAHDGRSYKWYLRLEKSLKLNREFIEGFFRKNFQVEPEVELIRDLQEAKEKTQSQIDGLKEELKASWELAHEESSAKQEKQQKIEQLEFEVIALGDLIRQISTENERVTSKKGPDETVADILKEVISKSLTPKQSLLVIEKLFPIRIVLLDTAHESADLSEKFRHRKKLFKLLWDLANGYWSTLASNKGDAEARKVFGESYAAHESESVMNSPDARQCRTFTYDGKEVPMMKHLKIGNKENVAKTIRVHFEWFGRERRIVIGYCGPHLPQK